MTHTRVITALIMGLLAVSAILFLPTPWLMVLTAIFFLAGLWEWLRISGIPDTFARTVLVAANLALMVAVVWASRTEQGGGSMVLFHLAIVIGVAWWLLASLWLRFYAFGSHHESWARVVKLAAGTLAIVPAWCALVVLHGDASSPLAPVFGVIPRSHLWLLAGLVVVWMADTGGYFVGRKFGKRKLSPRISPNKTWEGLAGGFVFALVFGLLFASFAGMTLSDLPKVSLAIVITVVASLVGDLFESLLKRHANVKDSSDLLPGHGGVLDRIDSVLAALPVFALCKAVLGF